MRSKFKWIFTLLVAFTMQFSFAQEKTVTGVVSDELGPIAGANVVVEGTTRGTTTDFDGNYTIKVKNGEVLVFSYTGKKNAKVTITAANSYNITLKDDVVQGIDVVVTAYGVQKKESITGSIAEVKAAEIENVASSNVIQGMVGKVAGVQVINNNGMPGDPPVVRFRGIGSINASSAPLYVVDGVPFNGDIASISNFDIESISFLKDASAAALYGNRGANGVIIVTTKKGKKGKSKVMFDSKVGFSSRAVKEYDILTSQREYYETYFSALKTTLMFGPTNYDATTAANVASQELITGSQGLAYNAYNVADNALINPATGQLNPGAALLYDENYSDYLFGDGLFTQSVFNISGSDDNLTHFFSMGYEKNEGYVVNSGLEKITSRLKLDANILDGKIKFGGNFSYSHLFQDYLDGYTGGSTYSSPFFWTRTTAPIYPVYLYDTAGNPIFNSSGVHMFDDGTGFGAAPVRPFGSLQNPYATAINDVKKYQTDNLFVSGYVDINLYDGLNFVYTATGDLFNQNDRSLDTPLYGDAVNAGGRVSYSNNRTMSFTQQQLLKYNKDFGKHGFDLLLGHETLDRRTDYVYAERSKLLLPDSPYVNQAGVLQAGNAGGSSYALEGYFSRLNYDFDNKYYINASIRRDGSSRFHPDNRWGTFYGLGAAWRVSQEKFMSNISWLNEFKLKASYGEQGNDNLGLELPYLDQYTVSVTTDTSLPVSFNLTQLGNRNITWEKKANFNAGFDLSLFDRRLNIEAEYFKNEVNDMLFNRPLPPSSGFSSIPDNVGSMQNVGFEVSLDAELIRKKDFSFGVNFNTTHYKNEITKLPENGQENNRIVSGVYLREEGGSVYDFYMREFAGVNPLTGAALFWMDDATTGERVLTENYNQATQYKIGKSAIPDFYGGFGFNTNYKGFDMTVNFAYQFGGYGYDSIYMGSMSPSRGENFHSDYSKTWTVDNMNASLPRVEIGDPQNFYSTSSLGLVKSDYLSIQNISLGYTFNNDLTSKLGLSSLRVYSLIDNVHLWSKRQGYDPRLSLTGGSDNKYSLLRTVSFGMNVQF
ncbi:SusC/RagA family TonB-linked outer membrane protein [Flavobacterium cyclinae]|uniref:SusC/RagA family TonB-linked outer membrane protein n=1 Tax=Flavobacterium cyclinae TaxID=2895947 RepID=UPI001E2FE040|nr:TonB-dependent receptor [Flavobacterium cyclinae]UGS21699.1 TonB-dependent receptor [Flavobacterium cyclinae]